MRSKNKMDKEKEKPNCKICNDTGEIEIMGDGANFEWDVVDVKKCGCQRD